ncbi:DUF2293 domain-containing protein [Streptomyces sp. BI20]|uniref:DUF2293 domain-containing protein n=1 Tax=Streptomyces sp. BI20 TaxID=3403460 RepID=UPI003C732ADC
MDEVVFEVTRPVHCARCRRGPLERLTRTAGGAPRCLPCAGFGGLVWLPRGDAALTRRARERSAVWLVVVRRNRRRGRWERQGLMVEPEALAGAVAACAADAGARAARRERDRARRLLADQRFTAAFAAEILRLFPGCPPERARAIAAHAAERGSGRVGRTRAGRALDEQAVSFAVRAAVRHLDTDYDARLAAGVNRFEARALLAPRIDAILAAWRRAPATSRDTAGAGAGAAPDPGPGPVAEVA